MEMLIMTTFLAIIVTFLLTLIMTFIGTIFLIIWELDMSRSFRDYWRGVIREYSSDYDELEEL
jgi:hypothetical protein